MAFQTDVFPQSGFGVPGEPFLNSPMRVDPYVLESALSAYNVVGAAAFTLKSQGGQGQPAIAQAGTGGSAFAGVLVNPKVYASRGVGGNPLASTMILPNENVAELCIMGEIIVALPGPASIGDLVIMDNTTGALSTVPPLASFTGVVATSGGVDTLTVSAISGGHLGIGSLISGTGVAPGTYIKSLGTGLGGNGTYVLTSSGIAVSSTAMTAPSLAPPAASFTGVIATSGGVDTLTASSVTGQISVGSIISGTGVAPGTVVTSIVTGAGGAGTYHTTPTGQTVSSTAMTADATSFVPKAVVTRYNTTGVGGRGVGVIKLTN